MTAGELEDARHAWLDLQRRLTALQIQVHNEADPGRLEDLHQHLHLITVAHNVAQDRYFYLRKRAQDEQLGRPSPAPPRRAPAGWERGRP